MSLLCGLVEQLGGFCLVLNHPFAIVIAQTKTELRCGKALLGSLAIPLNSFRLVCSYTLTFVITLGKIALC